LRRPSDVSCINITDKTDFIVVRKFVGSQQFFADRNVENMLPLWKEYVANRKAHLLVSRRFNISAPGTRLISFFSEIPTTPTKLLWSIKGISVDDSKVLALWFNSTLNILQVLLERSETEGAFLELSGYILLNCLVLNPKALSREEKDSLFSLIDKGEKFPSLLTQLKQRFKKRIEIDRAIMRVLGFSDDEIEEILDFLYPALAKEIEQLKALMKG